MTQRFVCVFILTVESALFVCLLHYHNHHSSTHLKPVPTHRYEYASPQTDIAHPVVNEEPVITEEAENKNGFMVALGLWEQQSQGLINFSQLQCFANLFHMRTTEPFLTETNSSYRLYPSEGTETQRLGNLIDMDVWNRNMSI